MKKSVECWCMCVSLFRSEVNIVFFFRKEVLSMLVKKLGILLCSIINWFGLNVCHMNTL